MTDFNTTELRKAVSLSRLKPEVDIPNINVADATYDGDTYPEGVIPLKTGKNGTVMLRHIQQLNQMLELVWGNQVMVQIGMKNRRAVLFVYN